MPETVPAADWPGEGEPKGSLPEFLAHARAGWRRALTAFLAVLLPCMLIAALLKPNYKAIATLAVLPSPEFTVRNAAGSHDPNTSTLAMDQIMKSETAILESQDLHEGTLRKLGPQRVYPDIFGNDPPSLPVWLVKQSAELVLSPWRVPPRDKDAARMERGLRQFTSDLDVLPTKDANVIEVRFTTEDGAMAASVVNTMLAMYAARRSKLYEDPQLAIVRRTVVAAATAAAEADARLADYKRKNAIADYAQQRDLLLHRVTEADQNAADAAAVRAQDLARSEALGRQLRSEPGTVPVFNERDPDDRLESVNEGLLDLRGRLAAAREKYLDRSRVVIGLNAQIDAAVREAARLTRNPAVSVSRQGRNPNLDTLRLDKALATADFAAADARLTAMQAETARLHQALDQLEEAEIGLLDLQRRRDAANDDFRAASRILAERHLSESEDALRLANVRIIQPAVEPQKPTPARYLVIGAGFVVACLAAFLRIFFHFVTNPVFLTADGLESATGIPVLAVFDQPARADADEDMEFTS
jgi:uncharacterized protein involved in exopolysaccharide biosynthesis